MIKNSDLENLKLRDKQYLIEFIEKVIYLSQKSQIDVFHNANWHLPNLVSGTFSEEYIQDICERYDLKFKS